MNPRQNKKLQYKYNKYFSVPQRQRLNVFSQLVYDSRIVLYNKNIVPSNKPSKLFKSLLRKYKFKEEWLDIKFAKRPRHSLKPHHAFTIIVPVLILNHKYDLHINPRQLVSIHHQSTLLPYTNGKTTDVFDFNPNMLYLRQGEITIASDELNPLYRRDAVDYYTEDEGLIFQYNTTIEYDKARVLIHTYDKVIAVQKKRVLHLSDLHEIITTTPGIELQ